MSFLCGSVVEKPPASARSRGPIPGLAKSARLGAAEPVCPNYCARALEPASCIKRSHCNKKPEPRNERKLVCSSEDLEQ